MKKLLVLLPLGGLGLLAGCNFLQKEPLTSITSTNFFQSATNAEASITAVYDALQGAGLYGQDYYTIGEMPTDNCTSSNNDVNQLRTITWTPTTSQVSNLYRQCYLGINRANVVIKYVPTVAMDTARRSQIVGEARFVRALCYFQLARAYGDVPLRLQPTEGSTPDEVNLTRTAAADVYAQVVADLQRAAIQMPASNPNRAAKNAANALLTRVQLTLRNWAAAQAAANKVIANNIPLNATFKSLYPAENKGPESLFEIQFAGSADGNDLIADEILPLPFATYSYPKFNVPTTELISFADTVNDKRWAYNGNINNSTGKIVGRDHVSYLDAKNPASSTPAANANDRGPFVYKWTSIGNGFNSVDNCYVLRYAEVLLSYAEAVNEQSGPNTDVLAKLNLVRQRAGLTALTASSPQAATKQTMRAEIERQRRLEFAFEGERWWDLVRYARHTIADPSAVHTITALDRIALFRGSRDVNYLLFPIPQSEINTNPKSSQNPGF